jgi:hypothetical protein
LRFEQRVVSASTRACFPHLSISFAIVDYPYHRLIALGFFGQSVAAASAADDRVKLFVGGLTLLLRD